MVTRVAAEEPQPRWVAVRGPADHLRRQTHRIAKFESEYVAVEPQRRVVVIGGEHDVTEALLPRHEPVSVRADDPAMFESSAVEHLEGVTRGVLERDHLDDATVLELLRRPFLERNTGCRQSVTDILQLSRIRGFPARDEQTVGVVRNDDKTRREVVHTQIQRFRVDALALDHSEDLESVLAPRSHVGGPDAHVRQRSNTHHLPPSSRKSVASRLNSSNFSSCAQ